MLWQIVFTVLAAWGLLCALWAGFGWLLSGSKPVTLVLLCPKTAPEGILDRLLLLARLGLLRCRLIAVGTENTQEHLKRQYQQIEFCTLAELPARIEAERTQID